MVVRNGMMDRSEALKLSKSKLRIFKGREPLKGLNVGDAKNLSHDNLERITNNFSDPIGRVGRASLFRGFMDDGQEVTVKTWDFMFPAVYRCVGYPRDFHDEIVLLKRSGLKSCPFFLKLVGFCFEKKLAIVYDLKFKKSLWLSFAEFGWKERMRVATNYALLLKTLTMEKLDLVWSCDDIMIDEEYNIKLINYVVNRREGETYDGASVSGISVSLLLLHDLF
ncbi:putative pachytene checkpoint protein 2 -like protein [Capsicum annuum]|nr:putative pachytene checkpoint protein 2 -like protein [Capsicum annuum]